MTQRRSVVTLAALAAMIAASAKAQSTSERGGVGAVGTVRELNDHRPDTDTALVVVAGYHTPGDGGGGIFVWQAGVQDKPDGGLVLGNADAAGRWHRVYEGPINVRMFGAKGDGKTDDAAAIQAAIEAAAGADVRIPAGTWLIRRTLRFRSPSGNHSPGLKLIGDGPYATIIYSMVTDGPAISIEQTAGYRFGTHGLLKDFDLVGESAKPGRDPKGQHGIVVSGAWQYRFDRIVVRGFRGCAVMVPFIPDRGGRYSDVDVVEGSNIAYRAAGRLFATINGDEVVEGEGIAPDTFVSKLQDANTLIMSRPALRSGRITLNIWGRNADGQSSLIVCEDCRFIFNTGWGIYSDVGLGLGLSLRETHIGANGSGGLRVGGYIDMHGGTVTDNGTNDGKGPGILLEGPRKSPVEHARFEAVEIDGNREYHMWLKRVRYVRVIRCRFNAVEREEVGRQLPLAAIRLGDSDGSGAQTVEFIQNHIRVGGLHNWSHVGFEIPDGAAVDNVVVRDTMFHGGWSDKYHVRYRVGRVANPAARIVFEERGTLVAGQGVPPTYVIQLRSDGRPEPVPSRGLVVARLDTIVTGSGGPVTVWPMRRIADLETAPGGAQGRLASVPETPLPKGTPILLLNSDASRLVHISETDESTLTFDRGVDLAWKGPAYAGGFAVAYDGHYTVEVAADVTSGAGVQPFTLMLLASGKPVHLEKTALLGLPGPQTLRLSWTARWTPGTVLHVALRNESATAVSVGPATITVRLLT